MNGKMAAVSLGLVVLFGACDVSRPVEPDRIFVGGTIWTADDPLPIEAAVAVHGDTILAVGSESEIRGLAGTSTEVVELEGRFLMPGFIDTHTHFLEGGFRLASVNLREAGTPEEFARILAEFARTVPAGTWILGGDWDHELWGGSLPDRRWIDEATPEHPVFVTRLDWHMALANSLALDLAGIGPATPDPAGGEIVRDDDGRLTGVLKDEAMPLVYAVVPEPSDVRRDSALAAALRHAAALGVTGVHDMGGWKGLETYRRARQREDLTLRVRAFVPLSTVDRLAEFVAAGDGTGDEWLSWGGLKGFVDGSLGSSTALFYEPYLDTPETRGLLVTPLAELEAAVRRADSAGLQVAIHAIGDRANSELLDLYARVFAEAPDRDRRYRIEHAQHLRPEDFDRFAELGVIPAMQPYHAIDDGRWAERKIGAERSASTYAFNSLVEAGARPAFGSDWTVGPLNPLLGVYAAVTRSTLDGQHPEGWIPAQKLSVTEALTAYTRDAARAGFVEGRVGRIAAGMLADLVILDRSPFDVEPSELENLQVEMTVVGGRTVFERGN
ncbi:MAG: amidohydrolase [marine benthic group bacterium]|nr:amidohydrolase [Gemmatimonadota bacterium]MCL7981267.1 amidohydrolase [Gemmatimonadota bacterium]MCL7990949.1 amidohydrolase [Gemmatimonadota bacterium]